MIPTLLKVTGHPIPNGLEGKVRENTQELADQSSRLRHLTADLAGADSSTGTVRPFPLSMPWR